MNASRTIGVPHRAHGFPCCPYACSRWEKYPEAPFTLTYWASKLVPPSTSARSSTDRVSASSRRTAALRSAASVGAA